MRSEGGMRAYTCHPAVSQRPLVKVKETYFYIESERTVNAVKQVSVLSVLRNFFLFPLPFSLPVSL